MYCQFRIELLAPSWHRMDRDDREAILSDVQARLARHPHVRVDHCLPWPGEEAPCDFLLRIEAPAADVLGAGMDDWLNGPLYEHLQTSTVLKGRLRDEARRAAAPEHLRRHCFLFTIAKRRDWPHLDRGVRQRLVAEHVQQEREFEPHLMRRLYDCDGLDAQQDHMYYIEADDPELVFAAYRRAQQGEAAQFWSAHARRFWGEPVTLHDWIERLAKGAMPIGFGDATGARPAGPTPPA